MAMVMEDSKNWVASFLSEPWWTGVQGILAVVALVTVLLAIAEFLIRLREGTPRAMAFKTDRNPVVENGIVEITVTFRAMGPQVLYEANWRMWGYEVYSLPDLPPVLDASSVEQSLTLRMPLADLPGTRLGVTWVVPRRWGSFAAGSRLELQHQDTYEYWKLFAWPGWPRRSPGRWVSGKSAPSRSLLYIP